MTPPERFPLRLDPANGDAHLGMADRQFNEQSQAFSLQDIAPGWYFIRSYGYPGWLVKSVTVQGRDVTNTPFEATSGDAITDVIVTMTNNVPQLSGSVRDGESLKADSAVVVIFPAERLQWTNAGLWPLRLTTVPLSNAGTYMVNTVPAGDYLIAAIDRSHVARWMDAAFLARLETVATRVTLTWGGKTSQDLTAVVVK
jgi:hypothetical protein